MKPEAGPSPFVSPSTLRVEFDRCIRYLRADSWQKPFINPLRFARNQWRTRGISALAPGKPTRRSAFHLTPFTVVSGECVSETIAAYGVYEPDLTEAFLRLIKPGQVLLDIGTHLGYYSTLFAQLTGPTGRVHAFEPTPSTRALAAENVGRFPNVTVHPYAVWSGSGQIEFNDFGSEYMAFNSFSEPRMDGLKLAAKRIQVDSLSLDDFCGRLTQKVALVKVDAESAEWDIVMGAKKLLSTDRPFVTLEVGDFAAGGQSAKLIKLIESLKYRAWEYEAGRFVLHQPKSAYGYCNLVFAPDDSDLTMI